MCKSLEDYPPPDRTKSPTLISKVSSREIELRRATITRDPFVESNLNLLSLNNIRRWTEDLCSYHNRHSKSQNIDSVANWLRSKLSTFGYDGSEAFFYNYVQDGYNLKNVICNKGGRNRDIILLCGHYDTILKRDRDDIISRAPGANDNASGVAALLEISRVISGLSLKYNIQLVFFSGEEQGFWGSKHYAQYIKDNRMDLHAVVNMDMCGEPGYLATLKTANIDIDDGGTGQVSTNNEGSIKFGGKMKAVAEAYTTLKTEFDPIDASDYMPFEARGYVCVGAYDGSAKPNNSHYHSNTDVISNLDFGFLSEVTKMVLGFILTEAK